MERWAQHFDGYRGLVEGRPVAFVIDLEAAAHAPLATHPLLVRVSIPVTDATGDGLPTDAEAARLDAVEDEVVDALETQVDAVYVGRRIHAGGWELAFYVPAQHKDDVLARGAASPHRWTVTDDPTWRYHDALQPDAYARQAIDNRRTLAQLAAAGDPGVAPRRIEHLAYFPSEAAADGACAALRGVGFTCDDVLGDRDDADDRECWALEFHRVDAPAAGGADRFTREILDAILPFDGSYDGWSAEPVA